MFQDLIEEMEQFHEQHFMDQEYIKEAGREGEEMAGTLTRFKSFMDKKRQNQITQTEESTREGVEEESLLGWSGKLEEEISSPEGFFERDEDEEGMKF